MSLAVGPHGHAVLQVLPEGTTLPPLPHAAFLVVAAVAVGYGLVRATPAVGDAEVVALVPWMIAGAAANVLEQVGAIPAAARPLFGSPSVYLFVGIVAGAVWLVARAAERSVPRALAAGGSAVALVAVGAVLAEGFVRGSVDPVLPAVGLAAGAGLGWLVAQGLRATQPVVAEAGRAALLAVVAHGVDGVTTAVGVDLLGFGERTPLSRAVIEVGATLPTADLIGATWLFVVVKLVVAAGAVWLIAPAVREDEREGYLLLTVVAAVGLGPGVHNALLFTVA
jgi:uncharacterized membrane protein